MSQRTGHEAALWQQVATGLLGLLGVLFWYLQLREIIGFRTGFLCNLAVLASVAACLSKRGESPRPIFESRGQIGILVALVVVGTIMRTIGFDRFPPVDGQLWEETQTGKVAYDSLRYGSLDPFFPLTNLLGEVGFRLFGVSMTALRLPFIGAGVVSVPLFFLASRFFLRTFPAAVLATTLFATSAYLSSASRVALETMAPIVTLCFAMAMTFLACTRRSTSAFALAGLANGVLMLEYFSYKLLPPLLACCLLGFMLQEGGAEACNREGGRYRLRRLRAYWGRLAVFALFALLVAVPLVLLDPINPLEFFLEGFNRQQVGIDEASRGLSILEKLSMAGWRIVDSMSFVFLRGGQSDIVAFSRGVIDLPTGVLGLLAVVYCAVRARRCPGKLFLVAAIFLLVVLSGALVGNPARYRLTPMVPVYLLAIACVADDFMSWLQARRSRYVALVLVVAGLCLFNLRSLARDVLDNPSTEAELYDLPLLVASEISSLQASHPDAEIYLVSRFDFLGGVSDYEFLYDTEKVRVVTSIRQLRGKSGYVIAHDVYAAGITKLESTSDCRSFRTKIHRNLILLCRLN